MCDFAVQIISNAEVLSHVPKCRKAMMYLMEKIHVNFIQIRVLLLAIEFNVDESTINKVF